MHHYYNLDKSINYSFSEYSIDKQPTNLISNYNPKPISESYKTELLQKFTEGKDHLEKLKLKFKGNQDFKYTPNVYTFLLQVFIQSHELEIYKQTYSLTPLVELTGRHGVLYHYIDVIKKYDQETNPINKNINNLIKYPDIKAKYIDYYSSIKLSLAHRVFNTDEFIPSGSYGPLGTI